MVEDGAEMGAKRLRRRRLRAIGRDDDEFVRPEPRQERSIAGRRQPVADFHQKPVAGRMAIDIVDLLELIDVNA